MDTRWIKLTKWIWEMAPWGVGFYASTTALAGIFCGEDPCGLKGEGEGAGKMRYLNHSFSPLGEILSFCLSKIKYPNKKTPPTMACGFPALLDKSGGCGTRCAQTVLAENSWFVCVARHGSRGFLRSIRFGYLVCLAEQWTVYEKCWGISPSQSNA